MRRPLAAVATTATALICAAALPGTATGADRPLASLGGPPAPAVRKVADTSLDSQALYFVSYNGLVNNNSFQKNGLLTYKGHQYATWYTADRSAVVARRALGATGLNAFGEVVVDDTRLAQDGVLSIMYQQKSSGTTPSAIRVVDFALPS